MKTFAIDPGPHTGIFYDIEAPTLADPKHREFCSLTLDYTEGLVADPHKNLYYWLMQMVNPDLDRIILESFEWRKEDAQERTYIDYSPGEFIGVVKLFAELTGTMVVMQPAALAKGGFWGDDKKVKKVGLSWKSRHERDAIKHWLYHQTFTIGDQQWLYKLK